ncbi:MAG TPA: Y-family DNA polymerase [Agriterribacter sp.]|nr:Y-family DNA polymerase [Agriterribacter sp.]
MGGSDSYSYRCKRCSQMYGLVDCNNFYCSVERVFNPKLNNRPVIVLSNNDGCAISRSDEAKALGIAMAQPAYMMEDLLKRHHVAVFSSNYTLYGDMSDRVMKTIAELVPRLEIYSIDEAFLDLYGLAYADFLKLGITIRKRVYQNTGIPVSVGIAPTKTLAKMANRYAKKKHPEIAVFYAANDDLISEMLASTNVGDIWGIGERYALKLQRNGFKTALDLTKAPDEWIRKEMSVVGLRLLNELRGIPAIKWEFETPAKKNICTSRSFGKVTGDIGVVGEAISNYAAACAEKLRKQKSCCKEMNVFIQTNPHKTEEPQYMRSIQLDLERASNNTAEIIKYALKGLNIIFKGGYRFMKCGVIVQDLVPEDVVQGSMFETADLARNKKVMAALDGVNGALGKETVRMAVQGFKKRYKLKAERLSPRYTTDFNQVLKIKN